MSEDYSKAVSFINRYFSLADGLVSGLDKCLAENVILDWFGKSVKGKNNVAAFMNTHKVNSRHVFSDIIPVGTIGYKKKPSRRKRQKSKAHSDVSTVINNEYNSNSSRLNFDSTPVNEIISNGDRSRSSSKIGSNHVKESDLTLELNDDKISKLFKLENIKSTNVAEIEQKINQISLEENSKSCKNMEYIEDNKIEYVAPTESSMKFVEAHGEILFSKKSRRQSSWNDCKLFSPSSMHTWRKPCKLQIAYSSQQICLTRNNNSPQIECIPNLTESPQKLLNFEEITEISDHLVPNVNDYAGYFRSINCTKEEDSFFNNFKEYLSRNEANKLGLVPRYVDGQLIFQKVNCDDGEESQNSFIFNHAIHVIIYEGKSRCRINLSQKFV